LVIAYSKANSFLTTLVHNRNLSCNDAIERSFSRNGPNENENYEQSS